MKEKWISIVGARPQFVKLAPLSRAVNDHNRRFPDSPIEHQILHTGQHYDREVADVFFEQMRIPTPRYNLGVGSGSHGTQLARMLARMEPILCSQAPAWVIVYGDTNSTLAGALLAARLGLRLAHIEAGCRSGDLSQPEEQNRIIADQFSTLLFAASKKNQANLHQEGIGLEHDPLRRRIVVVGDILLDALLQNLTIAEENSADILQELQVESGRYCLLTLHRAENTDNVDRLRDIVKGVSEIGSPVIFPVHPRTREALKHAGISLNGHIRPIEPQGYLQMLVLQKNASRILTDSGGVQKEAFYLRVPCITLRERTEWVETVTAGANRLVSANPSAIAAAASEEFQPDWVACHYGEGKTAEQIVTELMCDKAMARSTCAS